MATQPSLGPLPKADLAGRIVIVTGANTGLGFAASKHLATMNPAKLIMACRSAERGAKALEGKFSLSLKVEFMLILFGSIELKKETSFDKAEVGILDLSNFESVKAFADKFLKENERLDLLCENAGMMTYDYEATKDGWEIS
jgi:retinol dehydrogenase 12